MSVTTLLQSAQFVIDTNGDRKAVVLDYRLWEELLTLLEDLEDAEELRTLQAADEEALDWEQAKAELRRGGMHV